MRTEVILQQSVFPHGGNTVPGRCFTVDNVSKETDNDKKNCEERNNRQSH